MFRDVSIVCRQKTRRRHCRHHLHLHNFAHRFKSGFAEHAVYCEPGSVRRRSVISSSVSNDFPCAMTTSSPVVRQGSASAMMSPSAVRDLTINKPNEPPFQLKVEPSKIVSFRAKDLTQQTNIVKLELTNTTQCRQVFKFKVTSNSMFRVSPPLGFLDAGATLSVKLSAMCQFVPPNNRHFFTILHVKSDPNVDKEKSARQVWSPEVKPDGVCRLQASFEKEDGTPHGPLGAALTPMLPCSSASTMGNPK